MPDEVTEHVLPSRDGPPKEEGEASCPSARAEAVSSMVIPAKYRSKTTRAKSG
jgi:hypothetical protein